MTQYADADADADDAYALCRNALRRRSKTYMRIRQRNRTSFSDIAVATGARRIIFICACAAGLSYEP